MEADERVSATEILLLKKKNHLTSIKLPFSSWHISVIVFSRSIENDVFIRDRTVLYSRISNNTVYATG